MVTKHYLRVWLFAFVLFMSLKIASADKNKTINQDSTHGPISDVTSVIDTIIKAKWLNNAISAFTFTWDDNNYSHQQVGQILDSYGFKSSFFVNPGFANWETIKPIYVELSNNNHEIGNHTWSHLNLTTLSQEELAFQIIAPIEEITNSIGKQPVSFVQPFNASNPEVDSIVFEHHLFSRIRSQYTQQNRIKKGPISTHTLIDFQNWINESIESNKWLIIGAHGIDGFGWEPITSDLLEQVCQILEENQPSIWVGTLKEIAAYEYLKEELTIDYSIESDMLTINIEGLDHQKYNLLDSLPFTVLVSMDKCKKLVNIDSDITEVVPKPNAEDDLKQYAVTFDVKNAQHIQLRVEPEVSVFNIIGDEGYCEGEPGVTIGLNGSETNIWYYLIHNQSDTVAYQEGNSEFLFFENITSEGEYGIVAYDSITGCKSNMIDPLIINQYPLPQINMPDDFAVCEGDEITLTAEYSNGTLFWDGEIQNDVPFIIENSHVFLAAVISENGCKPALGSIAVTVNPKPDLEIPDSFEVCTGDSIILNAIYENGLLSWSNGITNNEPFSIHESDFYSATVISEAGCGDISDSVFINVNPLPDVYLDDFNYLCTGEHPVVLTGGSPIGGQYFVDGEESVDFIPTSAGEHLVNYAYTDSNGCVNSAQKYLTVQDCTNIADQNSDKINVYPNPVNDILFIEVPFDGAAEIRNLKGLSIGFYELKQGINRINLTQLKSGGVLILTSCRTNIAYKKVLIKN